MKNWYYKLLDEEFGPVSSEELRRKVETGQVTPDTLLRLEGTEQWHAADHVKGLFDAASGESPKGPIPRTASRAPVPPPSSIAPAQGPPIGQPPFARSPRQPRPSGGDPSAQGFAEELLRSLFGGARYLSVFVLVVGICTLAICLILLAFSGPKLRPLPEDFSPPQLADYEEQRSAEGAEDAPDFAADEGSGPMPLTPWQLAERRLGRKYPPLRRQIGGAFEVLERFGSEWARDRFPDDFDSFLASLNLQQLGPAVESVQWFVLEYLKAAEDHENAVERIELENEEARAAAASRRLKIGVTFLAALVAMLFFLVIPLLIQIEQNTRTPSAP